MWTILASGLRAVAAADMDDAANVAQEEASDATIPPNAIPGFDGKLPTPEQLLEMLDSMTSLSDEEKATLKQDLLKNIQEQGYATHNQPVVENDLTMQTMILMSLLGLVALIFVFFVYKLFKCLKEREIKREEKKKNKQLKKKK